MSYGGAAVATIVIDRRGRLVGEPQLTVHGMLDGDESMVGEVTDAISKAIDNLPPTLAKDDATLEETARLALRRTIMQRTGKKPIADIHIVRV
jgi:ribonuclease J